MLTQHLACQVMVESSKSRSVLLNACDVVPLNLESENEFLKSRGFKMVSILGMIVCWGLHHLDPVKMKATFRPIAIVDTKELKNRNIEGN